MAGPVSLKNRLKCLGLFFLTFFTTNNQKNNDKVHKKWNNDIRTRQQNELIRERMRL